MKKSEIQASLISDLISFLRIIWFSSGAAEIRTLVQTKLLKAFYMFSLFLDFRLQAGVQATSYPLIFFSFKIISKPMIPSPSGRSKAGRSLYTDK